MKPTIKLNRADKLRLKTYIEDENQRPRPNADQRTALLDFLSLAKVPKESSNLEDFVGLHDRVVIESSQNPTDSFAFSIVMPEEADIDADLISILSPVSLAALGRKSGDTIQWEAPGGIREMRIISIMRQLQGVTQPAAI
ncbi:GreA/GreB family elongation factor [Luteolibacter algae]|uniref:GreA/GreB family elongation factor n=1 Tax=Luteolibacter algae TaxID=454151 RepID=A0ABW5D7I5_9BACT